MSESTKIGEIALIFLGIRDQMKVYHWQTHNYARHKASDKFVELLSIKIDEFVEVMQGSRNTRLKFPKKMHLTIEDINDKQVILLLKTFRKFLVKKLEKYLEKTDVDLLNIRDEIVGIVNRVLYLFTFV